MNDQSSNGSLAPMEDNKSLTHRERVKEYYKEMRESCKIAVDMTADYLQNIEKHRPFPTVKPGFLLNQIPSDPPENGVAMTTIFKDVDELLLPGVTHWNHPNFHAYFAMANSYPALCADIVASGIGGIGFTWASSPVSTELEVIMMNWLVKMLGLPDFYLHHNSGGGGVIGTTCSEQAIVTMMAARNRAVDSYMTKHPEANKFEVLAKLVSYASSEAHCSVERAGLLNLLPIKKLKVDDKFQLTGATVEEAIREDIAKGLIPYYSPTEGLSQTTASTFGGQTCAALLRTTFLLLCFKGVGSHCFGDSTSWQYAKHSGAVSVTLASAAIRGAPTILPF